MKDVDLWESERAVVEQDKAKQHTIRYVARSPLIPRIFSNMKCHSENIVPMIGASDISPSWNQFRAPLVAGISIVLMAAGMTFLMRHFRVGLTPSDSSCSEGFYRLIDAPIRRGELGACPRNSHMTEDEQTT